MTDLATKIAELRELEEAATPGPWLTTGPEEIISSAYLITAQPGFHSIANAPIPYEHWEDGGPDCQARRDLAFIAALRNRARALLAVVEAGQDLIDCGISKWCEYCGHPVGGHHRPCEYEKLERALAAFAKEAADV